MPRALALLCIGHCQGFYAGADTSPRLGAACLSHAQVIASMLLQFAPSVFVAFSAVAAVRQGAVQVWLRRRAWFAACMCAFVPIRYAWTRNTCIYPVTTPCTLSRHCCAVLAVPTCITSQQLHAAQGGRQAALGMPVIRAWCTSALRDDESLTVPPHTCCCLYPGRVMVTCVSRWRPSPWSCGA
jgi:hypothetical protein